MQKVDQVNLVAVAGDMRREQILHTGLSQRRERLTSGSLVDSVIGSRARGIVRIAISIGGHYEAKGAPLAFVHLGTEEKAQWFFKPYGLLDVPRLSDPEGHLYQAFGLLRAELRQYLNSESIVRMLHAWFRGHFVGFPAGDIERMPGAFLINRGEIQKAFRHKLVSDRPDYLALATPN